MHATRPRTAVRSARPVPRYLRVARPPEAGPAGDALRLAEWTRGVGVSPIGELMGMAVRPGVISFALGLPACDLFPADAYAAAAERVLRAGPMSLQYGEPWGPLREQVVEVMALRGVACEPDQVFLTTAAQQAISLLARALVDPGGPVVAERLVYNGLRLALDPLRPRVHTVGTDPGTGMDVDALAALLRRGVRPAFVYAIPEGHNPLGVSMSREKREALVDLAARYGFAVVEDDAYGLLQYGAGRPTPPLRALDDRRVLYVGSFSKVMAPGFRVGWMVVPRALLPLLGSVKDGSDINTSTFTQRMVSAYLETGAFPAHVRTLRRAYRARRDCMLAALARAFQGTGARWDTPSAGLQLWLELPEGVNTTALLRDAVVREGVAYVPGAAFSMDGGRSGSRCMRLNFSFASPEQIPAGVERLARAVSRAAAPGHPFTATVPSP